MFESNSLNNLSNQNKLINGFYNAVKISYQLEDGKFDKEMKWLYVNPTANYIWLAYKIVHKIGNQNEFLSKFFIDNNEVPLLIKIEMFKTIQERVEKYKEFHLEETLIEKIYDRLKDNLSQITLEEFLKDDLIETHILSRYESFHLSLEKMSNELNEYIFKTQNNFFNILQKFKYWQLSSSGSRWLIDKTSLKKLINLNEINNYTIDLHKKNLDSNEKELLEIWERKNE
jgi:hypothetical protein